MIICPECGSVVTSDTYCCMDCGFCPEVLDGFVAWAPEYARDNEGFRPESFSGLFEVESGHFWFRARNRLIKWALNKYFPDFRSMLEVGCGSGFVLSGIREAFPESKLTGTEIYLTGLEYAARRNPGAELLQADARKLPYKDHFDIVGAFDVIEHIVEDDLVLRNLYRATKPGGGILLTVPQHRWLWSAVDVEACHQRRYSHDELYSKVEAAGFKIVMSTSFVTFLLPLMFLSRFLHKGESSQQGCDELRVNPILNSILEFILDIEKKGIQLGIRYPIGGSRVMIARKI